MWQESIKSFGRSRKAQVVAASTLSFAAGATTAFFVMRKRMLNHYEELLEAEIEATRRFYVKMEEKPDLSMADKYEDEPVNPDPDIGMVEEAVKIVREQEYTSYNDLDKAPVVTEKQIVEVKESIDKNVFETAVEEYDLDDELEKKNQGSPYIVEAEYFLENPDDYSTSTLTYYVDDDVVADDADQAMTASEEQRVLGKGNLRFGRGSGDPNVVYVCNDRLRCIAEVVRDDGSFKVKVLGYPESDSLEHSDRVGIRKFRPEE